MASLPIVIIESPFAGNENAHEDLHIEYGRACMRNAFVRGEVPYASHLLYTQPGVLDDDVPEQRELGLTGGHLFLKRCADFVAVYVDMGISLGMQRGIAEAKASGRAVEYRSLWHKIDPITGAIQPVAP
jgi:hypothetical protein